MHAIILLSLGILTLQAPSGARGDTACLMHFWTDAEMVRVVLPDSIATIRIPSGATRKGKLPSGLTLILEDSTLIDVWLTPEPATGFAATGSAHPVNFTFCDTTVRDRSATVTRVTLVMPGDSSFVGILNVVIDKAHALNVAVTTATATSRDTVLGIVASNLEFHRK
jgi:hypothetical protein